MRLFAKISPLVVLLLGICCLTARPTSAELTDEQKMERCNSNIERIVALSLQAQAIKPFLSNKVLENESMARSDLQKIDNLLDKTKPVDFLKFIKILYQGIQDDPDYIKHRWLIPYDMEYDNSFEFLKDDISKLKADDRANYENVLRLFLQDAKQAVIKKIDSLAKIREKQPEYQSQLKETEAQIADAKKALESYNCSALMKVEGPEPIGDMVEQGKIGAVKADPDVWALVEVISDPGKITEDKMPNRTRFLPRAIEIEEVKTGHYDYVHHAWTDDDQTKLYEDFHIKVDYENPPSTIKPGQDFSLKISGTCTRAVENMGGYVARWGLYEVGGGIGVKMTESSMEKPYVGLGDAGFVGSANATYEFTVPPAEKLSSEFTIEQKPAAIFRYKRGAMPIKVPTN